jgi:hypothetical protein
MAHPSEMSDHIIQKGQLAIPFQFHGKRDVKVPGVQVAKKS